MIGKVSRGGIDQKVIRIPKKYYEDFDLGEFVIVEKIGFEPASKFLK